ncbi:MAG: YraN family protein [Firmicutes bacterium]|nr:YraN family protein [Bacillota bacterium]
MTKDGRRRTGQRGETIAATWLQRHGYRILERNWRCPIGELDIVAEEQGVIVFVEVRTRTTVRLGTPEESVDARKRDKLRHLALWYLAVRHWEPRTYRIDLCAVYLDQTSQRAHVVHLPHAVEG